jgi:hypothetical protein
MKFNEYIMLTPPAICNLFFFNGEIFESFFIYILRSDLLVGLVEEYYLKDKPVM